MANALANIDFGRQVGPLPLGAWVAVVGGGLGIAYVSRRANSDDEPIIVTDTSGEPGVGVGGYGAYMPTPGYGPPIETDGGITSNTQWGQQAFTFLVSMGNDPALADKAVRDYLSGIALGFQSNAMIALALAKLGQPPEQLPDAPAVPDRPTPKPPTSTPRPPVARPTPPKRPAPPKNAPKPPTRRTHTVKRGDSLWKIAAKFYGNPLRWREIYNANRGVIGGNPNLIKAGQVLTIP